MTSDERQLDTKTKPKGLRRCFLAGFLIVFFAMGFWFRFTAVGGPPGTLMQVNLFQFYYYEAGTWLRSSGELAALMPSLSHILMTLGFHLVCAGVGAAVFLGLGWGILKLRGVS